jgi:hypothetical protein
VPYIADRDCLRCGRHRVELNFVCDKCGYNQLEAEVERLTAENHELHGVLAEVNRLRSGLVKVDPWHHLGSYEMRCRFCGNIPQYGPLIDLENEREWHKPDCIWLQAKLAEGGEE